MLLAVLLVVGGAVATPDGRVAASAGPSRSVVPEPRFDSWVYQLQDYPRGRLDAIAASDHDLAVIDLARDADTRWFRRREIAAVQRSGKKVLAYFEIGSIENFRPEYRLLRRRARGSS